MRANTNSYDEPDNNISPIKLGRKPPNLNIDKGAFREFYDNPKKPMDTTPPRLSV